MTINLGDLFYLEFQVMANYEHTPVTRAARRAISDFLARGDAQLKQPVLPLNELSDMRSLRKSG